MAPISRRCPKCESCWPSHMNLTRCPDCDGQLKASAAASMDSDEASRRLLHAEFNRYYRDEWLIAHDASLDPRPSSRGRRAQASPFAATPVP